MPRPERTTGPCICEQKLKFSKDELRILNEHPKFSIFKPLSKISFLTEVERMSSKHRYRRNNKKREKKQERIIQQQNAGEDEEEEKEGHITEKKKTRLTDYFQIKSVVVNDERLMFGENITYERNMEAAKRTKILNQSLKNNCLAGISWARIYHQKKEE